VDGTSEFDDVAVLSAYDQECLVRAIEFALPVRSRSQFFVWAQTYLQSLIAHELLLCACGDFRKRVFTALQVSARHFSDKQFAEITDQRTGLMASAIDAWSESGDEPLAIFPDDLHSTRYENVRELLERYKLRNLVIHGARGVEGAPGACFMLGGIPHAFTARHAYLLVLILPYLRRALERILTSERPEQTADFSARDAKRVLTQRETEILRWVQQGKRTPEIAIILEISPLTVNNHVQHILKKLNAQNRAQAVSHALALRLLN
jgi:transcriptional regulator EpsA